MGLGLEPEVTGDVPSDLLAPGVGNLGQPAATALQGGAALNVGVPSALALYSWELLRVPVHA